MKYLIEFMDGKIELVDVGEEGFVDYRGNFRWAHFIKQAGVTSGPGFKEMSYKEVACFPDCNIRKISSVKDGEIGDKEKIQRVQEKT